jgi:hypothetical protein
MALAPLAGANPLDDTLSRSFPYVSVIRAETAPNTGVGWYDNASPPNVCVISLLGVQLPVVGSFYYETLRVYTNLPGFAQPVTTPGLPPVLVPCPAVINPLCNVTCAIHVVPVTVGPLARTIIPQDGLICTQQSSFVTCIATSAKWTIAACPWASSSFTTRPSGSNKGFLGGTGLENVVHSWDINCAAYANAGYDVSYLLGSGGDPLSSGFDGVPASLLVPFNDGNDDTSDVVQCLSATYTRIDTSVVPPGVTTPTEDGVDYELILDLDDAFAATPGTNWVGALAKHVAGTGVGGNIAMQGVYDLGGDNGCDFAGTTALPQCSDGLDNDGAPANPSNADIHDNNGCWHTFFVPVTGTPIDYYDPTDNSEAPAP